MEYILWKCYTHLIEHVVGIVHGCTSDAFDTNGDRGEDVSTCPDEFVHLVIEMAKVNVKKGVKQKHSRDVKEKGDKKREGEWERGGEGDK